MKRKLIFYLVTFTVIILVLTLQGFLTLWSIRLNLTLLPVYMIALKRGTNDGLITGVFTGFLEDMLSGGFIGPSLLGKGLSGLFTSYVPLLFYYWRPFVGISALFLFTLFDDLVVYLSLSLFSGQPVPLNDFLPLAMGRALFNAPVGLFLKYKT
ncbi:MAG: rod shape-determining protein MreD [Nitrospirae bacterium]|nr:MAG: rod shape-determining protein MreD [Nitrospirota bacterium]